MKNLHFLPNNILTRFFKELTNFVFYFQKLVFGNINKKQFSCIFEIKNMFGQLKLKNMGF